MRGLSDRDIESLINEAGLGHLCCAKSLAQVELLVLFLDAVYLPTRPSGAKEGALVGGATSAAESACC